MMNVVKLEAMLRSFFIEDFGEGDITSKTIFSQNDQGTGHFIAKKDGIICGIDMIKVGYSILDKNVEVITHINDGDFVKKGECIATVKGSIIAILGGERVILNLLQRMSGISTLTRLAVDTLNDPHTRICDTRKTTPGLRMLEKYAVRCGGGYNHRIGLYDGVMIKDNHITACGSITAAVQKAKSQLGHMVKIEVETETEEEVIEAIEAGADVIMFDNRSPDEVRHFNKIVPNHIITEASGGIQLENLSDYRNTGVDYISLGFLTHSVSAFDISLNVEGGKK